MSYPFKKNLREVNPDAAKMWDYDLNDESISPDNIGASSNTEVYFRCIDNPKHVFLKRICKITSDRDGHNIGCIYCGPNAKIPFPGETDFFAIVNEAKYLWDFDKNNLVPTELFPYSAKKAYFTCDKGHTEIRRIAYFTRSPKCQTCEKTNNSLVNEVPSTKLFWNSKRNRLNLDTLIKSYNFLVFFKCPECNYEWQETPVNWSKRIHCKCCGFDGTKGSRERNKEIVKEYNITSFAVKNPTNATMWRYDLNGDMTPDNILWTSSNECYFTCSKGHDFNFIVRNLTAEDGKALGCPICNANCKKVFSKQNDLFTLCKEARDFWDLEKNDGVNPTELAVNSGYKADFKCPKRGHEFKMKIQSFTTRPYCRKCDFIDNQSLIAKRPEALKFWDENKNLISPYDISPWSKEIAFWKCKECGYEWEQIIQNRVSAMVGKCPSHDLGRVINIGQCSENSFRSVNPEASKLWIDEMNGGLTPDNVAKGSGKTINMRCANNPEHIYPKIIVTIPKEAPYGCPYCTTSSKKKAFKGESDIFTLCKEAKDMWDFDKNRTLNPFSVLPHSRTEIWFKCNKGHSFIKSAADFLKNPICQDCKKDKLKTVAFYLHLVKQWDFRKNKDIDINLISANSKEYAWWKCNKCGYEWQAMILSRKASKGLCPCCENRTVVVGGITDLFTIVSESKDQYDFEKNKDINTSKLSVTTLDLIWWLCPDCGYDWQASPSARVLYDDGNYRLRQCPSCSGQVRTMSYGEEYSDLASRFINKLNHCKLSDVKSSSFLKDIFWWHCDICGENFEAALSSMIRARNTVSKGCSYCSGKKVIRENSFASLHPEVMDEFDPRNIIDPFNVTERSGKVAKWICRNNPMHRWEADFNSRSLGRGGCNICLSHNYVRMFYEYHPEFESYYHTENNTRRFNSYSIMSNEYVWWKCDKGHEFEWTIMNFSRDGNFKCPICDQKWLTPGENTLADTDLELAKEWSLNNEKATTQYYKKSYESVLWICPTCSGEYQARIRDREVGDDSCPYCTNRKILAGFNTVDVTKKELIPEWSDNNERPITDFTDTSSYTALWNCPTCSGVYQARIRDREVGDDSCPYCTNRKVLAGFNTVDVTKKELIPEWSDNNERPMTDFTDTSSYTALWNCPTCSGVYQARIRDREVGDDSCPYCTNRKVLAGFNTVDVTKKEFIPEWSDNNERPMTDFFYKSSYTALWNCPTCNGEYQARIRDREVGDDSCPYCTNKKVLPGYNSFAVKHDDLMLDWDYINNYLLADPEQIGDNYNGKVWWFCRKNSSHKYIMSPKQRVYFQKRHMESCTYCKGLRRKKRHFI